jgi:hypothetical protein
MIRRVFAIAILVAIPGALRAQDVTRGIAAYQNLDFAVATTLLRRALSTGALDDATRVQALTYLGAAEHYLGHSDSAAAAYRRLAILAPRYTPDSLVFPPEITQLYERVRSRTAVVTSPIHVALRARAAVVRPPPSPQPVASSLVPEPATPARGRVTASAAAVVASVRAHSQGAIPTAGGAVPGMSAHVRFRRFELGVQYLQGSLATRDLVAGTAALEFVATSWLTLQTGPSIRRYEMPSGAERWATWRLGARAETAMFGSSVRAHALLWRGLGLSVNVPPGSGSTSGGEVGWTIDLSPRPFWFGLVYGIDRASLRGGGRRETVDMLILSAGLRRP